MVAKFGFLNMKPYFIIWLTKIISYLKVQCEFYEIYVVFGKYFYKIIFETA